MPRSNVIQGYFFGGARVLAAAAPARVMGSRSPTAQAKLVGVRPGLSQKPVMMGSRPPATVQPKGMQLAGGGQAFAVPASLNLGTPGAGQPLPAPVQQKMESFFGTSFAEVRVHVGQQAPSIGALAFTHGSNLYFAPGQYNPTTMQGQQLLGHELTHVLQQRAGRVRNPLGAGVAVVQDNAMEAEADRMGIRAAAHTMNVQPKAARR